MVYALFADDGRCLWVGCSESIGMRLLNLSNIKPWWSDVCRVEAGSHATIDAARDAEARLIATLKPEHNVIRHRIAPPRESKSPTDTEFLSVAQAATELHITRRAVIHRIHAGTLPAIKLGPGTSAYVIAREDLDAAKGEATS